MAHQFDEFPPVSYEQNFVKFISLFSYTIIIRFRKDLPKIVALLHTYRHIDMQVANQMFGQFEKHTQTEFITFFIILMTLFRLININLESIEI